jgi:hypothetical protein
MKRKNAVLAIIAFGIAIGGAFASTHIERNAYVHARLNTASGPIVCVRTTGLCDDDIPVGVCTITIAVTKPGLGTQQASSTGPFKTYKVTCTGQLFNSVTHPVSAFPILEEDDAIYELID